MLGRNVGNLELPVIGLGTYDLAEVNMKAVIRECISKGINFIDSANRYENEAKIGDTIKNLGIKRETVVLGTKLSYRQQISQSVCESVDESLYKLKTDYIDLYMIHSPKSLTYCDDWMNLQIEKQKGKILETAVSNFTVEQLRELKSVSGVYPALNQIEVNFVHNPNELISFCMENNIIVQASCPLYRMANDVANNRTIKALIDKYQKTYAQIALRWLFQKNILAITKMSTINHIEENANIFDFNLSYDDMIMLEINSEGTE